MTPAFPAPTDKRDLRRLVKCARASVRAPLDPRDHDANDDFDVDNAAVEWVQSLSYSIGAVRRAIAVATPIRYLDSRGVWCIVEPEKAVRRLITIARRAGFEFCDGVKSALLDPLPEGAALPKARRQALHTYRVELSIIGRAANGVLGSAVVDAPNQSLAKHHATVALWNPRLNAGLAHYVVRRLSPKEAQAERAARAGLAKPAPAPAREVVRDASF